MTKTETLLWNRLEAYQLDETDVRLTFSQRLARENGWNLNYTQRVIEEYKKFLFLCCTSPEPVTPSDPVDQAWHLHLTYTKSYWNDLCKNILEREIHHNPTKGGKEEQKKFSGLYKGLHELYFEKFGVNPPPDIWHDNETRFSDINFQRVNLSRYWLVKKPGISFKPVISILFATLSAVLFMQAASQGSFTIVFIVFMVIAAIQSFRNKGNGRGGNGTEGGSSGDSGSSFWSSCSSDSHHHGEGHDSGCSSHGDSGCSSTGCSSGCSGCGGGCGGGD